MKVRVNGGKEKVVSEAQSVYEEARATCSPGRDSIVVLEPRFLTNATLIPDPGLTLVSDLSELGLVLLQRLPEFGVLDLAVLRLLQLLLHHHRLLQDGGGVWGEGAR